MRLKSHLISLALSIVFILLAIATGSKNEERTKTTISLTSGYLNSCSSKSSENIKRNLDISIIVNEADQDAGKLNVFKVYTHTVENDDSVEKNYLFKDIEFPKTGYCSFTVEVRSSNSYNCCSSLTNSKDSKPYYRGSSILMAVGDIPESIDVKPSFILCY